MRIFLFSCLAAAGLAVALPAAAARRAPSSATVTIVIPAFPAASITAAVKKAMKDMPGFRFRVVQPSNAADTPKAPPGVLKFAPGEINVSTSAQIGKIISLYPATLPKDRKGQLIVVKISGMSPAQSVVQPDSKAFTLHTGERIVLVRSRYGWARVLPYNGPKLSH